MFARTY